MDALPEIRQRQRSEEDRSEEHTSELQSPCNLVCRLLLEKKKLERDRRENVVRGQPGILRPGMIGVALEGGSSHCLCTLLGSIFVVAAASATVALCDVLVL